MRHSIDLLSVKDPLSYQAVSTGITEFQEYDPSDEAEIERLRKQGLNDSTILDEWGDSTDEQVAWDTINSIRTDIYGE